MSHINEFYPGQSLSRSWVKRNIDRTGSGAKIRFYWT